VERIFRRFESSSKLMKKNPDEMYKRIAEADSERLSGYIDMFDRLLLYNLAAGSMPPEIIDELIIKWAQTIKTTINTEVVARTHFLDTLDTAKAIVARNLQRNDDDIEFEGSPEF